MLFSGRGEEQERRERERRKGGKRTFASGEINRSFFSRAYDQELTFSAKMSLSLSLLVSFSSLSLCRASLSVDLGRNSRNRGVSPIPPAARHFHFTTRTKGRCDRDASLYFMPRHLHRRPRISPNFIYKQRGQSIPPEIAERHLSLQLVGSDFLEAALPAAPSPTPSSDDDA